MIRQQQGRHEEALQLIGRAIELKPNAPVYESNYGAALLSLGRHAQAVASFRHALAIRPDYADALANLGMAQAALGDDLAAEASFRRALQCQAWHRDAITRLAGLLERQDRAEAADQLLESALAAAPCGQFHFALGNLRLAAGEAQQGAEHYHAAMQTGVTSRTHAEQGASDRLVYDGKHVGQVAKVPEIPPIDNLSDTPTRSVSEGCSPTRSASETASPTNGVGAEPSLAPRVSVVPQARKIAFVSPHCVLDFTNGAATATLDALKLLAGLGFHCEAFCGSRFDAWAEIPVEEVLRQRGGRYAVRDAQIGAFQGRMIFTAHGKIPVTLVDTGSTRGGWPDREEIAAFLTGCEIFLDRTRPDVVWTYGGDPVSLVVQQMAKQRGIPILFGLHNFSYPDLGAFRMVDRVVVPTEFARKFYQEKLGLACEVLPLVVDLERVRVRRPEQVGRPEQACAVPALAAAASESTRMVEDPQFVGGMTVPFGTAQACSGLHVTFVNPEPRKGVHVFARIAEVLSGRRPDIPLLLVEGASKASFLPKLGIDLSGIKNLKVMANTPDARQFLVATKVLLMPSLMENAAVVAMEAMLNGIPVLASNRGGLPETIGDAGFLFDIPAKYTPETREVPTAAELEPWVDTVIRLWDDAAEYERWSQAARERAQQWHPDCLAPIYREFFGSITHQPGLRLVPRGMCV